ncbi:hypothetical protein HN51_037384 [Arachis hypogaea]
MTSSIEDFMAVGYAPMKWGQENTPQDKSSSTPRIKANNLAAHQEIVKKLVSWIENYIYHGS